MDDSGGPDQDRSSAVRFATNASLGMLLAAAVVAQRWPQFAWWSLVCCAVAVTTAFVVAIRPLSLANPRTNRDDGPPIRENRSLQLTDVMTSEHFAGKFLPVFATYDRIATTQARLDERMADWIKYSSSNWTGMLLYGDLFDSLIKYDRARQQRVEKEIRKTVRVSVGSIEIIVVGNDTQIKIIDNKHSAPENLVGSDKAEELWGLQRPWQNEPKETMQ